MALHDLGVVWGDVKPDNLVSRGDSLVAVDFGSSCVEVGSAAQRELGADADTSFTARPGDQFAWSVQYAAPERARSDQTGAPCVARRSQVVSLDGTMIILVYERINSLKTMFCRSRSTELATTD